MADNNNSYNYSFVSEGFWPKPYDSQLDSSISEQTPNVAHEFSRRTCNNEYSLSVSNMTPAGQNSTYDHTRSIFISDCPTYSVVSDQQSCDN